MRQGIGGTGACSKTVPYMYLINDSGSPLRNLFLNQAMVSKLAAKVVSCTIMYPSTDDVGCVISSVSYRS